MSYHAQADLILARGGSILFDEAQTFRPAVLLDDDALVSNSHHDHLESDQLFVQRQSRSSPVARPYWQGLPLATGRTSTLTRMLCCPPPTNTPLIGQTSL